MNTSRRRFLQTIALVPAVLEAWGAEKSSRVRFGIITDVHQDVMHDGVERVRAFGEAMAKSAPDFVLQCGDFCVPHERNRAFIDEWNKISCPRHHVLGNHDMDGSFKREQTVAFYGMPARHYAFDVGPLRGIILDGNDAGGKTKGYARFIAKPQLEWLSAELARDTKPALVFVHQPIDGDGGGVENSAEVRAVLEAASAKNPGNVAAVFSGHLHRDYQKVIAGIPYLQINSASYVWLAGKMARASYAPEIHKAHPSIVNVAPYRDPIWAEVTVDRDAGRMIIAGRSTEWVGDDPWKRGASEQMCARDTTRPAISDRELAVAR